MKQENINRLHQARRTLINRPDTLRAVELINAVLLDENGAGAVPFKELAYECQACFTQFQCEDQTFFEHVHNLCPSCWHSDLKIVPTSQDRINAVLET